VKSTVLKLLRFNRFRPVNTSPLRGLFFRAINHAAIDGDEAFFKRLGRILERDPVPFPRRPTTTPIESALVADWITDEGFCLCWCSDQAIADLLAITNRYRCTFQAVRKARQRLGLYTPKLQKRFCDGVADGNTFKTMCDACGIGERTFYDWMERYPAFAVAVHRARARAKAKLVRVIVKQAPRDWRAAAFLLERSWPKEYARVTVERIEERDAEQERGLTILYQTSKDGLAELLDFPNLETDSPKVILCLPRGSARRVVRQTQPEPKTLLSAGSSDEILSLEFETDFSLLVDLSCNLQTN